MITSKCHLVNDKKYLGMKCNYYTVCNAQRRSTHETNFWTKVKVSKDSGKMCLKHSYKSCALVSYFRLTSFTLCQNRTSKSYFYTLLYACCHERSKDSNYLNKIKKFEKINDFPNKFLFIFLSYIWPAYIFHLLKY